MRRFITQFSIFIVLLICLLSAFQQFVDFSMRHSRIPEFSKWNDIYSGIAKSDIVIMGNSRGECQYNPLMFDSILYPLTCYNISTDARSFPSQFACFKVYLTHCGPPKYVICNVDYCTFSSGGPNGAFSYQFLPFINDSSMWINARNLEKITIMDKFVPGWKYLNHSNVLQWSLGYRLPKRVLTKGFDSRQGDNMDRTKINEIDEVEIAMDSSVLSQFQIFLNICHDKKVQVFLVFAPAYVDAIEKMKKLPQFESYLSTMAMKNDCIFINYVEDKRSSLNVDSSLYYNTTHLNGHGADCFSMDLAKKIDSIIRATYAR